MRVTIQQAKTQLSQLIRRACEGEEVIILRGTKPVARLEVIEETRAARTPGAWKGRVEVRPEFFDTLPPEELEECE